MFWYLFSLKLKYFDSKNVSIMIINFDSRSSNWIICFKYDNTYAFNVIYAQIKSIKTLYPICVVTFIGLNKNYYFTIFKIEYYNICTTALMICAFIHFIYSFDHSSNILLIMKCSINWILNNITNSIFLYCREPFWTSFFLYQNLKGNDNIYITSS